MTNNEKIWEKRSSQMNLLIDMRYLALDLVDIRSWPKQAVEMERLIDMRYLALDLIDSGAVQGFGEIYNSRGWRFLCILYKVRNFLLPNDSLQYRICRKIFRGLRLIKGSFKNNIGRSI